MNRVHIGTAVAAIGIFAIGYFIGYRTAPREILDEEVTHPAPFTVDTKRVLSATVESIKAESKLVSYSYLGTESVSISRDKWYIFEGHQTLSVPTKVSYYVDLATFKDSDVAFDEAKQTVLITLPKLMINVAFEPERNLEVNTGSLSYSDDVVQELRKLNYATARKAAIKQAQQSEFVKLGRDNATKTISWIFTTSLRAAGKTNIQVQVEFAKEKSA